MLHAAPLPLPARLALAGACLPCTAYAAGPGVSSVLTLPFLLGIAIAAHVLISRGAKALASVLAPLATGELEVSGYERQVYGTADRAMQEVVALVLAAGLVLWIGMTWSSGWLGTLGVLMLLGAVALDMSRWERVTVSASYVWFQRGLGRKVHQVAIENIRDVAVNDVEATGVTLRHFKNNRVCRLTMRMKDKRAVALPKTDAHTQLDAVETLANHIRARQQLSEDRDAVKRSSDEATEAATEAAKQPSSVDREMLRELKRLRQRAQGPDLPPAVKPAGKS